MPGFDPSEPVWDMLLWAAMSALWSCAAFVSWAFRVTAGHPAAARSWLTRARTAATEPEAVGAGEVFGGWGACGFLVTGGFAGCGAAFGGCVCEGREGGEGCAGREVSSTGCAGAVGLLGAVGTPTGTMRSGAAEGSDCHGRCAWWLAVRVRPASSPPLKQARAAVGTPTIPRALTPMTIFRYCFFFRCFCMRDLIR
ncbi:hypothetical protein [Streptomyces sp. NPDC058876]|uniref:hypothetical protein n=1 Tax=Streptomyces sp. NPDC058876 TaxID=3346664 RepID=UPI0036BFBDAA